MSMKNELDVLKYILQMFGFPLREKRTDVMVCDSDKSSWISCIDLLKGDSVPTLVKKRKTSSDE